jgi:ribosomal protein S12 methylthiotransferase
MAERRGRVHLISLGCAKNQVDAERMLYAFGLDGFRAAPDPEDAEVVLVNTCAFIRPAEEEAVEALLGAAELKRRGRIQVLIAAGCLVARYGAEKLRALIPEVDAAFLPAEAARVAPAVRVLLGRARSPRAGLSAAPSARVLLSGAGSAFLRIAEGCSRRCAFCLIPALRGRLRSTPRAALLREAEALVRQGAGELIVVAQDITQYGRDLKPRTNLNALLDGLVKVRGLRWLRLMYAYPDGVDAGLIRRIASEKKICKYLDMPVQHSEKSVLRRMGRPGDGETYLRLLARLRRSIPEVVLRTTLLTGFPGETEAEHRGLKVFLRQARFDRLGVFAYSPEAGTRAAAWPGQVPARVKARRRRELMEEQTAISRANLQRWVGKTLECLVEEPSGARHVLARTRGDAPEVDGGIVLAGKARPGQFVRARVTGATDHDLTGEIV